MINEIEALIAADPDASLPILEHCDNRVSCESTGIIEYGGAALINSIRAGSLGADPEGMDVILDNRAHPNIVLAMGGGDVLKRSIDVTAEPTVRPDPHAAIAARRNGPSQVALQSLGLARGNEFAVSESQQAFAAAADPQTSFLILEQRAQLGRGELIGAQHAEVSIAPTHEAGP